MDMEFPKRGIRKEIRPGYSGLEVTNTELGDRVEAALATKWGWTPLVGPLAGKARQGTFDLIDEEGTYVEVKAVSVHAAEYKVKTGALANTRKTRFGHENGVRIGTVMAIVEQKPSGKLKAWVYRRNGIGCFRLGPNGAGWAFVGKVTV
jgi:hypothetical protein